MPPSPNNSVEKNRPQAALVGSLRGFAAAAAPRQTLGIKGTALHRAGIFRSSVLVDLVNYAGIPLLALYVSAMFIFPWFDEHGNWAHVQAVWDRWQTLNAGALAFLASLIAFNIAKFNENIQREREFVAAKSFLPSTLSELMQYFSQSARVLEGLWEANGYPPATRITHPDLPPGYREVFSNCIRHADPQVGTYLSNILVHLQVHDARLRDATANTTETGGSEPDRYSVIAYLYRLGQLYALVGKLFSFARGEESFDSKALNWEDFRNAFGVLEVELDDIYIDDKMNLFAFTQRILASIDGNNDDA
jgi:uncharacterized short protein YbdD (DUF466 family)